MTDRILPAIATPRAAGRPVHRPASPTRPTAVAVPRARKEAFLTTPARAGILLGGTAAVYAVTLASVASLQSASDATIAAQRQPWADAVVDARTANDALEQRLLGAAGAARSLAGGYEAAGGDLGAYQARLDSLAVLVADIDGSVASLPARIALPKVTMHGSVGTAGSSGGSRAPSSTSTSGASGG
jgi:hypothetical protein